MPPTERRRRVTKRKKAATGGKGAGKPKLKKDTLKDSEPKDGKRIRGGLKTNPVTNVCPAGPLPIPYPNV